MLVIIYTAWVKPFELPLLNRMEVFNEYCILLASVHLFLFTDFIEDPVMHYKIGYSIIGVTIVNIIVNMMVMVWATLRQLKLGWYELRYKYRLWRLGKNPPAKKYVMAS